jgi:ribonuclease HI
MVFLSFIKKIFAVGKVDEAALDAARARHGIKVDAGTKAEANKPTTEAERFAKNYDAWEELKHLRSDFFFGRWVTRKFYPIGEDKVKKELEELERKRQVEAEREKEKEERKS